MSIVTKLLPLAAIASLAVATPALADTVPLTSSDVGKTFSLTYNGFADGTVINGLSATSTFTLTGVSGSTYNFDYSVTNTTSGGLTSRVSSFAFNTDPNIVSANSTGAFAYTTTNSNYPNGIGSVDVCFKDAQTGSCAGGGSGGLTTGQTGTGTLALTFASPITALTLGDFYNRYQSITGAGNVGSASGSGTVTSTSTGGTSVPEPGMVGLLGGAVAAMALLRRRRKTVAAEPALAYA